ncbi:MAG: DUF134 domain-containing protein [Candidatus Omnitrophota bacterium]|jgi:predicted DNA-binding protein (UPF0251 family)
MNPKGRPRKYRIVKTDPRIVRYSPRGKPGRPDEIDLKMEEFEAIRLIDFLDLKQREAARSMRVSQQTFSRILRRARRTLSDAFIHGKIIRIQGGTYVLSTRQNDQPKTAKNPARKSIIRHK